MKILRSWSGNPSKMLGEFLRDWLKSVFPDVTFWVSSRDIQAGKRWGKRPGSRAPGYEFRDPVLSTDESVCAMVAF